MFFLDTRFGLTTSDADNKTLGVTDDGLGSTKQSHKTQQFISYGTAPVYYELLRLSLVCRNKAKIFKSTRFTAFYFVYLQLY